MKSLSFLASFACASFAFAQEPTNPDPTSPANDGDKALSDSNGKNGFWEATLPGGSYMVALSKIASISKHQYLLDGTLIVTEVNIDTVGDTTVRIYQITPAAQYGNLAAGRKVIERGKDLLDRAGQRTGVDLANMVQKTYPTTTHSKIVEFRVKNLATLDALHDSARQAWMDSQGRKFVSKE